MAMVRLPASFHKATARNRASAGRCSRKADWLRAGAWSGRRVRRMIRPCFLFNPDNLRDLPVAGVGERLRFLLVLKAFAHRFAGAEQMHGIKRPNREL